MASDIVVGSAIVHGVDGRTIYSGDPSGHGAVGLRDGVSQSRGGMAYIGEKPTCAGLDGKGLTRAGGLCESPPGPSGFCFGHVKSEFARSKLSEFGE